MTREPRPAIVAKPKQPWATGLIRIHSGKLCSSAAFSVAQPHQQAGTLRSCGLKFHRVAVSIVFVGLLFRSLGRPLQRVSKFSRGQWHLADKRTRNRRSARRPAALSPLMPYSPLLALVPAAPRSALSRFAPSFGNTKGSAARSQIRRSRCGCHRAIVVVHHPFP